MEKTEISKMKRCSKCRKIKPITDFSQNKYRKDKYRCGCRDCQSIYDTIVNRRKKDKFNGLYRVWGDMRKRCCYTKYPDFDHYGGRGITVCKEWKYNFPVFYNWAKDKHKKGLEIDRINNDGNYEPTNCRFITHKENIRNSSATKLNIAKVKEIKKLLGEKKLTQGEIAKIFNVGWRHISSINVGKVWEDVNQFKQIRRGNGKI